MSLPIIVVFERHWDVMPKLLMNDLLPNLADVGYDTLCYEFAQNFTAHEIVKRHNYELELDSNIYTQAERLLKQVNIVEHLGDMSLGRLTELMRLNVSSREYTLVAEKIKQFAASKILKEVLQQADKLSISIKGIDLDAEDLHKVTSLSTEPSVRIRKIDLNEDRRINTFFGNILKLHTQQKGIIFVCGALHADNLLLKFAENGMQDDILYYFPYSSKISADDSEALDILKTRNKTLRDHSNPISKHQIKPLVKTIVSEIAQRMTYEEDVLSDNSHSSHLSKIFNAKFMALLRPGYYVDALVDIDETPTIEKIKQETSMHGIKSRTVSLKERRYLVISAVNTKEVAEKIRGL